MTIKSKEELERNGELNWNGLPYIGKVGDIKKDDSEEKQPRLRYGANTQVFDTTDEESLKAYTAVNQRIAEGKATMSYEDRQFIPEKKGWLILITWFDLFYVEPEKRKDGGTL